MRSPMAWPPGAFLAPAAISGPSTTFFGPVEGGAAQAVMGTAVTAKAMVVAHVVVLRGVIGTPSWSATGARRGSAVHGGGPEVEGDAGDDAPNMDGQVTSGR